MADEAKKTELGHLSEKAYYSIKKNIIFAALLGPIWALVWFENMTACLNSAKRHKKRQPALFSLLASLIPGLDIVWALGSKKRLSDLRENCGVTTSRDKATLAASIVRTVVGAIIIPVIIALVVSVATGAVVPTLNLVPDEAAPLIETEPVLENGVEVGIAIDINLLGGFATVGEEGEKNGFLEAVAILLIVLIFTALYALFSAVFFTPTVLLTTFVQLDVNDIVIAERKTVAANETERRARVAEDREIPHDPEAILEIRHLRKTFPIGSSGLEEVIAVDDVSFKLMPGETLGIVGESGCGKTTLGRAILKLHEPSDGQIIFNGEDITHYTKGQMRRLRTDMQIIFQDPYSSLPPRSTVGDILSEPVKVHNIVPKGEVKDYVLELMDKCGLRDYYYERFPHEFSGGQRQRICIARALSVNPKLVVCDEPVSALDVSIQAQIINLLKELQRSMNLTYLFISHDLSVVKYISDKIGVMYLGSMVEFGTKDEIFSNPLHPYTKALFSAIPNPNPDVKMQRITLEGDIPSPANPPSGCRFHTRCPYATPKCAEVTPEYRDYGNGHFAACHLCEDEAK